MRGGTMQRSRKMIVGVTIHDLTARRQLRGEGWRKLRPKYLRIYRQNNIYCQKLGGMVIFEFKTPYKLSMPVQQRTLCALIIIGEFRYLLPMSQVFWEDLVASPLFSEFPDINQNLILDKISAPSPTEIVSTGDVASKVVAQKFVSMEALAIAPTLSRSPRPKPTHTRETQPQIQRNM